MLGEGFREYEVKPELYFDGHSLAYDSAEDVYYITQNMGDGFFSGVLKSSEGRLYWQKDRYFTEFADALAKGHLFSLYCIDEDTKNWCRYRVVFSGMPIMVIETQDGGMIRDDTCDGEMRLFDLRFPGREYVSASCQTNIRGGTSRGFAKKGYKLTLDDKQSLLGMRRDEDWILAALYDDHGLIHNKFSYDVWRDIAGSNLVKKDGGTTMEYVELFCNDTYLGVYGLIERIDAKELSLGETEDILYKCYGCELPEESWTGFPCWIKPMRSNIRPRKILQTGSRCRNTSRSLRTKTALQIMSRQFPCLIWRTPSITIFLLCCPTDATTTGGRTPFFWRSGEETRIPVIP